jgi:glucose-6-phosphate 1-dehydrogenase
MATAHADSLPLSLVIFGASGDLTAHKLIPALHRLHIRGRLPGQARVVGGARADLSVPRPPGAPPSAVYPVGSNGPPSVDDFISRDGCSWLLQCH